MKGKETYYLDLCTKYGQMMTKDDHHMLCLHQQV